jgi:hypothetical protein
MKHYRTIIASIVIALLAGAFALTSQAAASNGRGKSLLTQIYQDAQVGQIHELQAAFHRAATLQAPDEVDIEQRISDMLALWTDDGSLSFGGATYQGKTPCAPGSLTLCDFFTNVAPPFQNPWISFAPSFKTDIDVHGRTATLSFQCHYFDVDGVPKARILVDSQLVKAWGHWRFDDASFAPGAPAAVYP